MKAFITGITGFAGSYLAQLLLRKGVEVYGMSTWSSFESCLDLNANELEYFSADVREEADMRRLLDEVQPDLVFHLAAKTSPAASVQEPRETFEVNFLGTLSLLEAVRHVAPRARVLLVSSGHVYGGASPADGPIPESAAMRPRTPYAASKAASELLAYQYGQAYGTAVVRVRAFNHTGPGQPKGFVCPDLASQVAEIEAGLRPPRLVVSNLDASLDFSDVRDIVSGYYAALLNGRPGEVYNLCSGKGIALQTIVRELVGAALRPIEVQRDSSGSRESEAVRLVGDNSRGLKELGWRPSVPFAQTLREVLEFWRSSIATRTT